jgi:RNA polymerase sigma-70 factor (ECF subfamily)
MDSQSQARCDWLDEIVNKYADMVFRLAFTRTKNQADANDVFQDVFLKLCGSKTVFDSDEHVKAWLIRVTINTSRSFFGSVWNKKTVELSADLPADEKYPNTEIRSEVIAAVKQLPQKYGTVIHLFYYEEMSVAEIASALGANVNTIKSRLARARKLLKPKLERSYTDV